ncbi:hypothetical protein HDU83_000337 [Entophlyctis luteolus]|nr:hypothetical protein HDU83_000337 [Entophlyctis luteolus]
MGCCASAVEPEKIDFTEDGGLEVFPVPRHSALNLLRYPAVNLTHFELISLIGKGAYGKVKLVRHKQNLTLYALKYIDKKQCIHQKAVDYIIQERDLLESIHSHFVCNLRYSFQDDENMFMVLDMMKGGDLRFALVRKGRFDEKAAKFVAAEICLALMYLHSKKIVHRDLKPENILLDSAGHACLTDFNIATRFKESRKMTAVAGSLSYMAPEILEKEKEKKGYTHIVDWWSLGVVLFELVYGKRPFRGKTDNQLEDSIRKDALVLPTEPALGEECIDIIKGFLTKNPAERLGSNEIGGDVKITEHPWFKEYDWEKMENLEGKPVYVPDDKELNVDAAVELEDLLFAEKQLKARPRKSLKSPTQKSAIEEKMEKNFKLFDFTKLPPEERDRKRSAEWDDKMSQIHPTGSMTRSILDIRENRSTFILFEADAMTVASAKSDTSLASAGAMPEMPPMSDMKKVIELHANMEDNHASKGNADSCASAAPPKPEDKLTGPADHLEEFDEILPQAQKSKTSGAQAGSSAEQIRGQAEDTNTEKPAAIVETAATEPPPSGQLPT